MTILCSASLQQPLRKTALILVDLLTYFFLSRTLSEQFTRHILTLIGYSYIQYQYKLSRV